MGPGMALQELNTVVGEGGILEYWGGYDGASTIWCSERLWNDVRIGYGPSTAAKTGNKPQGYKIE